MTPRQRKLADELVSDFGYVTGEKPFPGKVSINDAIAICADLQTTMDGAADARAEAAVQLGQTIACGPGCSGCCEELVMIFLPEAHRIARWLERPENAATKKRFLDAYTSWKERTGDAPARAGAAFASEDEAGHLATLIGHWRKRIVCAFNQDGMCTIYSVRPLLCRNAHALGTNERCSGENAGELVQLRLESDEVNEFHDHARSIVRAMHHALGGPRQRPGSLCESVYELLTRT